MDRNDVQNDSFDLERIKEYTRDISCKSEKEKRKELGDTFKQLVKYAEALNITIGELKNKNEELQEAYLDTINHLVLAAESKDKETGSHIVRMRRYSTLIAEKVGLPRRDVQNINYAAPMHDVGKIGIPNGILIKPGKLTVDEFEIMETHATIGAKILANSNSEIIQMAQQIAISHHEKYNGRGYPQGLSGEKIPLVGMIVNLADVFDALTSRRPYKDPYPVEVAVDIIKKESGQHFDPGVVEIFLENLDEIIKIKSEVDSLDNVNVSGFTWSERDRFEREKKNVY